LEGLFWSSHIYETANATTKHLLFAKDPCVKLLKGSKNNNLTHRNHFV